MLRNFLFRLRPVDLNSEHRTRRLAHQLFRQGPQDPFEPSALRAGRYHDEICVQLSGKFRDDLVDDTEMEFAGAFRV